MADPYIINQENAHLIAEWIEKRGGIAQWDSINLSNPGGSWTTPLNNWQGNPNTKPNWQCGGTPSRIITSIAEVQVATYKEVKRFHVAVRESGNGLSLKVTDGGTRRIRKEVEKASEGCKKAHYEFDYSDYNNCVILVQDVVQPLAEYLLIHPAVH